MDTFSSQPRISFFQPASAQNHRSHTAPSAWTDLGDTASLSLEYNPRVHGRQDDTPFNELSLNSLTIHEPEHDAFPQYYRQEELIDAERVIRWGAGKTFNTSTGAVFPAPHLNRYPSHDNFGINPTLTVTAPADGLSSGLDDDTLEDGPAPLQKIDSFDLSDDEDFPPDTPALDEGRSPSMADSQDELDALEDDSDIWMPPPSRKVANIPRRAMTPATFHGAVDTLRASRPGPQSPIERLARYLPTPDPSSDSSDDDEYTNSRPHKRKAHFTRKQSVKRVRATHIETVVPSPSRPSIHESSLPATTGHRDQPPEHPDVETLQKNANRKFVCPYEGCNQETSSRGDLRRHFQTAKHKERSFFCLKCSKGFTREDALLRHLRRRTCKPSTVSVKDSARYV